MKPEASSSDHPSKSWLKEQIELHMKREENCSHMSYDVRNSCNEKCEEGGKACDTYEKLKALHAENPGFWTEKLDHE